MEDLDDIDSSEWGNRCPRGMSHMLQAAYPLPRIAIMLKLH